MEYKEPFSFLGRAQLINFVLISIKIYWVQIFLLPQSIMHMINSVCRNFLQNGKPDGEKKGFVKWVSVCTPKANIGLGVQAPY